MIGWSLYLFVFSLLFYCHTADAFSSTSSTTSRLQQHQLSLTTAQQRRRRHRSNNEAFTPTTSIPQRISPSSSLHSTPAAVAIVSGAISGGLFAGGLHAVAGKQ
jgi:hypothetical protein